MSAFQKQRLIKLMMTVIMLGIGVLMILPFLWMLSSSFKPEGEIFTQPIQWVPRTFIWSNYPAAWSGIVPFSLYLLNTIKVSAWSLIGGVTICLFSAYAFAKIEFKGRNLIFVLYVITLMFPNTVLLVPRLVIYRFLGIYNTHLALILPGFISTFGTFLLRQYFLQLPNDLFEAARIDGASELRIFGQIAVPLIKAGIAAFAIFHLIWCWNDYENPLMFVTNRALFTIPVGIVEFRGLKTSSVGYIMAASVMSLVPLFAIFLFAQKYFVEGIAMSGIKS